MASVGLKFQLTKIPTLLNCPSTNNKKIIVSHRCILRPLHACKVIPVRGDLRFFTGHARIADVGFTRQGWLKSGCKGCNAPFNFGNFVKNVKI